MSESAVYFIATGLLIVVAVTIMYKLFNICTYSQAHMNNNGDSKTASRELFADAAMTNRGYTSYTDMVLQETIANRKQYLEELKARDVSESYPWIAIDGVWEQPTLFPSGLLSPAKGNEPWRRQRQWVPHQRQYREFAEVLYVGNPLPQ